MRILYLTNNPHLGSTARILQAWVELGQERGVRPKVVGQSEGDLIGWLNVRRVPALVDSMPAFDRWQPWRAMWHCWRVARFAGQVDAIHVNEHDVYPFVMLLKRQVDVPVLCHVRYKLDRGFAQWAFRGRRCPDALLWTSQQQKHDSRAAVDGLVPEERQHIVPLGFDLATYGTLTAGREATRQQWGLSPGEIVVGTASPLRPRKRVHEFVDLIARLAEKHKNIVGLIAGGEIAGDEAYREQIERQISATGLGRRLRWLGFLEPVEPFYHACDIQVSTSEYETFGNSVCEAMACARPVAAYRGGSVAEVVGDSGLIVETGDLPALTAAVDRLIVDGDLRQQLGHAARLRVAEHFNPRKSFEQLRGIYQELVTCRNSKKSAVAAL
jgi:glycosyltransferase involved in cell wall biosynthesis